MNRDEVMAMTDEQLRIMVAELRGWEDVAVRDVNNMIVEDVTFKTVCGKPDSGPEEVGWLVADKDGRAFDVVPNYPNVIAAAWELAQREPNTWKELARLLDPALGTKRYNVRIVMPKANANLITRAFILAMEDKP